jgi:hypothetical protein
MLMKVLYIVLALSIVAIIAAVGALLWRLRWHLGRPHVTPPNPSPDQVQPDQVSPNQDPAEKT